MDAATEGLDRLVARHLMHGVLTPYSTDIRAARQVVEQWEGCCYTLYRESLYADRLYDVYEVQLYRDTSHGEQMRASGNTAPIAICRAALRAAGVEPRS